MEQLELDGAVVATLDPKTNLGHVHLTVSDMERSLAFYQEAIGLTVQGRDDDTTYLGAGDNRLLALTEKRDAIHPRGRTGLYHFALLTPSRLALAHALQRLIDTRTRLTGGSDHGVSEALYLDDPDGIGIEIYRDRARSEWPLENGRLQMTLDPLDYEGLLAELGATSSARPQMEPQTVMGHVHLHVAHLEEAVAFYTNVVGFELMQRYGPSAAFVSAGGYHHHIGLNTWQGIGAPPPPLDAVGLRHFEVKLVNEGEMAALQRRLDEAQLPYALNSGDLLVRDPSQNTILFSV
jgi:catechol 2,3-dioxygenase